ncbi:alpha/beta fold hydrolase [Frigidibacter sp.]|uniref:alpha/beta fold hydrolase n=1 Tax=Frigidibacter sp. TaxID=2586418 RepID=UPI002736641E|nr:alpha/beta hydrolase [Frigidibacter sp.]MDP3339317.1 alpha/beta hydrolase [Frigidibacter sp.]
MWRYALDAAHDGLVEVGNGAEVWCWDSGGVGETVVLAHAHTGNYLSWAHQVPALAAQGFRIIAWSRRGYFRSSPLVADDAGTQADDLAALLDARGVAQAHLVGVAAGGASVLDMALSYPHRALSVCAASSLMGLDDPQFRARVSILTADWFRALPPEAKELGAGFRSFSPEGVAEWARLQALNPPVAAPKGTRFLQQPLRTDITTAGLGRCPVPVLLMTGAADAYMPPRLLRQVAFEAGIDRVTVFEDAAHAPHVEAPEAFNAALVAFFRASSPGRSTAAEPDGLDI